MLFRELNMKNLGMTEVDEDWFAGFANPKAVEIYFNSEEVRDESELREVDQAFYGLFDSVEQ